MNTQRHESGEFFYGFNDGAPLDDVADGTDESTTEEDVVEDEDSIEDVEEIPEDEEEEFVKHVQE